MSEGEHILVVDDDPEMRDAVGEYLELRRYRVSLAGDGNEMLAVMREEPADLILLDIGLPGVDGIQLAQQIRATYSCGIIMVTGHGDPEDRVLGLEIGADDYVVKPFNFRELLARINSVLRRSHQAASESTEQSNFVVQFGEWTFDPSKLTISYSDGSDPELSSGELDILAILAGNAGKAVSRQELLDRSSHRDWSPLDRSIDVRITRLRKKLEQDPAKPRFIRTARNVGYILMADPVNRN